MSCTEINRYKKSRYFPGLACCIRELSPLNRLRGGEGGIRTHGTLAGTPVFETGTFNHSATSPGAVLAKGGF